VDHSPLWQRVIAFALLPVIIPAAAVAELFSKPVRRTPDEVANYLDDFIDGSSGPYDWDDFISLKIADPALEGIRARAASLKFTSTDDNEMALRQLLAEAEALQRKSI